MASVLDSSNMPTVSDMTIGSQSNTVVAKSPDEQPDEQQKMFTWDDARLHLQRLVNDWKTEVEDTEVRRRERKFQLDTEDLRQRGDLDEDETIVPRRMIDSNIRREQPAYVNYIKNSRRIVIMTCDDDPSVNCDVAEQDFTKLASYEAWELPHYKCIDGAQVHGWDTVEVVYDETKAGHFAVEHVGHDKFYFPRTTQDLQKAIRIARGYDVTLLQLQTFITKYGFDPAQVNVIRDSIRDGQKEAETVRIYKLMFKQLDPTTKKNCVYVSWFCLEYGVGNWLKKPEKLYLGIDKLDPLTGQWTPDDVTYYPYFVNIYLMNEEAKIVEAKGRCFYDGPMQEAMTALWSSFVNGMTRASNIYASPEQDDGSGTSLKELTNLKLRGGRVLSKPVDFWHPDYPDPVVLNALQHADTTNAQENNQVNFATMNREDSRKTAKEISAAQQQQQLLNTVQLTLFSTYVRQVYSFCWLIVKSQAAQNKIFFKRIQQPKVNPVSPQLPVIDPQTQQPVMEWTNDVAFLQHTFTIRAAGDVDVVAADETAAKMQQDWAFIAQTPLASTFMVDYIKLRYPEHADRYAQELAQADKMMQLESLAKQQTTVLNGLLQQNPDVIKTLPAAQQQQLMTMMTQGQALTGDNPQ